MLGIHWPEFMLIAVVTVLVVGPKELPRVLRTITRMLRKIRGLSKEFQDTMNDLAKEADLDDMKKDFTDIEQRVGDMRVEEDLGKTLDGDNKIASMFTGDVIGTELAQNGRPDKAEAFSEDDDHEESGAKALAGTQATGEAAADAAKQAREDEEKERSAAKARKIIDDAYDDLEQDLLKPSPPPPPNNTDDSDAATAEGEGESSTPEKAVEKVAAPDGR